jgi:6-phosphogluconate dehydrogenase (decarboxylating)
VHNNVEIGKVVTMAKKDAVIKKEDAKVGIKPYKYNPKMLDVIRNSVAKGIINSEIAKGLKIAESTLYEWKKNIPEVAEAFKQGEEWLVNDVERALYRSAKGYDYKEVIEENGEIKKVVTKHMPGNVVAQQVILYNRRPDKWQAKRGESTQNINVNFQLEDWEKKRKEILDEIKRLELSQAVDVEAIPVDDDSTK